MRVVRETARFDAVVDPAEAIRSNDVKLRKYFRAFTETFLSPLERYLDLVGIAGGTRVTAYHEALSREEMFSPPAFIATLTTSARLVPPSHLRTFPAELYKRFMAGPHFNHWLTGALRRYQAR